MENKLIKKFCKSNKNGKLYKNKPEGLINYISFYKNSNNKLKPYSLTFKKNKKNKYNLCKDSSCKKEEYVITDLSYKYVKKLMKNIDDFKFAKIREKINLDSNLSSKIKLKTYTKKQKANKFIECKEILEKNKSLLNKIKSKNIFQKEEKVSQKTKKKFSFDFLKKLIPKKEKKIIQLNELPQQHQQKTIVRESNETDKLKKEKEDLLKQLLNSQQQQLPNINNSEKQQYLEKIKSLESKLQEISTSGENNSDSEKELKKMSKLINEYDKELKNQKAKIKDGSEKKKRLEYNKQKLKSETASQETKLKKYKSLLQNKEAQEQRLRKERNHYKSSSSSLEAKLRKYKSASSSLDTKLRKYKSLLQNKDAQEQRLRKERNQYKRLLERRPTKNDSGKSSANSKSSANGKSSANSKSSVNSKSSANSKSNTNNSNDTNNSNSDIDNNLLIDAFDIFILDNITSPDIDKLRHDNRHEKKILKVDDNNFLPFIDSNNGKRYLIITLNYNNISSNIIYTKYNNIDIIEIPSEGLNNLINLTQKYVMEKINENTIDDTYPTVIDLENEIKYYDYDNSADLKTK
jgi:hypothetical protein